MDRERCRRIIEPDRRGSRTVLLLGKKFVVDPQVHGDAEIVGQDAANISYGDLLTILHVYGFTAVEYGGYVNVIPSAGVRSLPPLLSITVRADSRRTVREGIACV